MMAEIRKAGSARDVIPPRNQSLRKFLFYTPDMTTRSLLILATPLLLAGCVNETASYAIDSSDHALTVIVTQDYFWSKQAGLRLIASRLPDCQRQFVCMVQRFIIPYLERFSVLGTDNSNFYFIRFKASLRITYLNNIHRISCFNFCSCLF